MRGDNQLDPFHDDDEIARRDYERAIDRLDLHDRRDHSPTHRGTSDRALLAQAIRSHGLNRRSVYRPEGVV